MEPTQEIYAICNADFIANQRCKDFALLRLGDDGKAVPWQIVIIRWGKDFHGYVNRCPHQGSPLNFEKDQFFDMDRRFLMCGKHGALFDITTGICVEGPCHGQGLQPIRLLVVDGDICVTGVRLVEDDSMDSEETMEIMIHPE